MKKYALWAGMAFALAVLILSVTNASWLAPYPAGAPKLIAHRGLAQDFDRADVERDTCTATRIEQPYHGYLENTVAGIKRAQKLGAWYVEVDIAPTKDSEIVLFHDWTLDCRTDGSGEIRSKTLGELKALDIGHGYTSDGGKTYPFRGKGVGAMPTLEEAVKAQRINDRLMYNFKSADPAEADLLAAKLAELGRDPVAKKDAFYGHPDTVNRIRELYPNVWAWSPQEARTCAEDYIAIGWSGYLPESCRGKTMVIPVNYQWPFWGWPNRLIARMEAYGGEVIVTGPYVEGQPNTGLTLPEQLTEIPASFNGYVWVEDGFTAMPALFPSFDDRNQEEIDAAQAALERRRKQ